MPRGYSNKTGLPFFKIGNSLGVGKTHRRGTHFKFPHPFTKEHLEKLRISHLGKSNPNKGKKGLWKHTEEWKLEQGKRMKDEKHFAWKGNKVSYRCLHLWIQRKLGKAQKCVVCGKLKTTPKSVGWANIDHKYKRNLTDWISLCVSCHAIYDGNRGCKRKTI
jgi:hypothetical protein